MNHLENPFYNQYFMCYYSLAWYISDYGAVHSGSEKSYHVHFSPIVEQQIYIR